MRTIGILLFLFAVVALGFSPVQADRGIIPVSPEVSVYEPGQKAIIAWNGQEEILILSTDVTSSRETLVLEFLPVPSEPQVDTASFQSFEEIQSLIWKEGVNMHYGLSEGDVRGKSVEVVFHEKIGAHDIRVVRATGAVELVDWIEDFLQTNNMTETVSLGEFEPAVEDYMGRGFRYYVLDLVTVGPDERSVNPIFYRFNSTFLYYPLVITSPVEGETEITLFLLTEEKVEKDIQPMRKAYYQIFDGGSRPIEFVLSKGDLSKIDLRLGELFEDAAWLTVLKYDGNLSWLTRDLMISQEALIPDSTVQIDVALPSTLIALSILLGAACTLVGVVSTFLITRSTEETAKTS